jgi:hypothetical protein
VCTAGGSCSLFPYVPSNFDPVVIAANGIGGNATINCNDAWFNSTDGGAHWCGGQAVPVVTAITQDAGVGAVVLAWSGLTVNNGRGLTLVGSRPVIIAVYGDVSVDGFISARSGVTTDAGAGSNPADCNAQDGAVEPGTTGAGGGGGGYGQIGGDGGTANSFGGVFAAGGRGGSTTGNETLDPLRGGCPGGWGGRPSDTTSQGSRGGAGGGAVQISAAGNLILNGTVTASGAGGVGGRAIAGQGGNGGGGGGSGGAILLEGNGVDIKTGAELTANGGGGGAGATVGSSNGGNGGDGTSNTAGRSFGGTNSQTCAGSGGQGGAASGGTGPGVNSITNCGAGGGGGAAGRIRVNGSSGCGVDAGVMSPAPTFGGICP